MTQRYNLQKIGELLQSGFSDQELRDFCFYTDSFRLTVYETLPEGAGKKAEIIRLILDYAARQQLLETVLAWAEETNPEQFKVYQAELVTQQELAQETPYRGLAAFREEDAPLFFGRKTATAALLTRVLHHPLLAVFGASGSGKSSLVFAGLIPQLRAKGDWLVAVCRPQVSPFSTLAAALLPHLEPDLSETQRLIEAKALATALRQGDLTLTEVTIRLLEKSATADHLLLIVDQFEELFTLCPDATLRHRFLDVLLEATGNGQSTTNKPDPSAPPLPRSPAPLHLCLTLRADYLAEALTYRPLADALQTVNNLMLGPMTPAELRQAIETPAKFRGVTFQPGLVERILADVGHEPGHLPLLEFALASLWLQQSHSELSHPAYEAIGEVAGALSGYADTVFAGLSQAERDQARRLFLRLVQPGEGSQDTRRLAYHEELDDDTWHLAQKLAADRLVVTNRDPDGGETVEVIHEALITGWDQLRTWIDADRAFLTWRKGLRFSLEQWQASGRDDGALLRGKILQTAGRWLAERGEELGLDERVFIGASVGLRQKEEAGEAETRRQLLVWEIRATRKKNLQNADLKGVDLNGANLSWTNLTRANLHTAKLNGANLHKAVLSEVDLSRADLSQADLSEANLSGANLHRVNLTEANLRGTNLRGADLDESNLYRADLTQTNMSGTSLSKTNMRGVNLYEANLRGANLRGADLDEAKLHKVAINSKTQFDRKWSRVWQIVNHQSTSPLDLHQADLRYADLSGVNLSGANLTGADLGRAYLTGTGLNRADLSGANLTGADLGRAYLAETDLRGANLSGAYLAETDLRGANLSGANLHGADLHSTIIDDKTQLDEKWRQVWKIVNSWTAELDLINADLSGVDLRKANLRQVNLSQANLSGANLHKANLRQVNLSQANLQETNLSQADLRKANLHDVNLRVADLSGADLRGTSLSGANLWGADLSRANLWGADLRGANLHGANLWGADLSGANLSEASLNEANLRESYLRGTNLGKADLNGANLRMAKYTETISWFTVWPVGFDPAAAGAVKIKL